MSFIYFCKIIWGEEGNIKQIKQIKWLILFAMNDQPFFTIITATIGSPYFCKLLDTINKQTFLTTENGNIEHIIAIDNAPTNKKKVEEQFIASNSHQNVKRIVFDIPLQSGADGYLGYTIYSSMVQFAKGQFVIFLDDDNELRDDHLMIFFAEINKGNIDWLYSLRTIIDENSNSITIDDCESLGHLAPPFYNQNDRLIDMNCYCVSSNIAKLNGHYLNRKANYGDGDGDRIFAKLLMLNYPNFNCTKQFSLLYRITPQSKIRKELFIQGKQYMHFGARIANIHYLQKPVLYIAHFDKKHTDEIIERHKQYRILQKNNDDAFLPSVCFKQWQLNMFDWAFDTYQLISCYNNATIPTNSVCIFHICHKEMLPKEILDRKDLHKILMTIESPNHLYKEQWNKEWMDEHFTNVITYWQFLQNNSKYSFFPFVHRLDIYNKYDVQLVQNNERHKSVCIILQNRPNQGTYEINKQVLQILDHLRLKFVAELAKILPVYCYGESWQKLNGNRNIFPIALPNRHLDKDATIDYYKKHIFALVLENCNADGYVSEKIFDAWMVGCIPIYYGNFNRQLLQHFEGIPLQELFICAKTIGLANIAHYISSLTDLQILYMQQKIENYKFAILERVGIRKYGDMLQNIIGSKLKVRV
jgi:hypothetical protein